jgi:signal transduction histidine kinase
VVLQALTRHGPRELACAGSSATGGSVTHIALDHQGEAVGTLTLHLRAGQRTLDAADRTMLELLGDQLGPLVHGIGLREQLRLSREQIVAAREEERRRLRRDLHDGLGPTLAGIRLRLDTAAAAMVDDSPRRMVEAACADAAHSLTEVRRLTHGLRPPDLDRGGLVGALRCLRNRLDPTGVCVDARLPDLVPELSAACEVAAYRIAAEALTNVVRHAKAHTIVLCLAVVGNDVTLEITDDGIGLSPAAGGGVGLGSMKERAEEIGGTLTVASGSRGTVVRAVLPIQGQ